jgi:hypothetical protein
MLQSFTNQFALSTCIKLAIQAGKLIALLYECNKGIAAATSDTSANGRTLLLGSCHTAVWSARVLAGERPHPRKCVAGAIWWCAVWCVVPAVQQCNWRDLDVGLNLSPCQLSGLTGTSLPFLMGLHP